MTDHDDRARGQPVRGAAFGVLYVAWPPAGVQSAPLVVGWHLIDPPSSEAALATALPMTRLPARRVYLGLPLTGARSLSGGVRDVQRRAGRGRDPVHARTHPHPGHRRTAAGWSVTCAASYPLLTVRSGCSVARSAARLPCSHSPKPT
jgi:hypothetical protein